MMHNLLHKTLPYLFLFTLLTTILYATGARIPIDQFPSIKERVLSMMTEVPQGFVLVVEAIDGDTIVVDLDGKEETIRLLGVDTPETRDPRRSVQCFGKEASKFTKEQVLGKPVRLLSDASQGDRDKYDRLLRYVYFEDGTTLNERLVYEGYAFAYEAYPTMRLDVLKRMEADAREHKRGLWGGCEVTIKNGGKSKSTQAVSTK